jgi:ribosomal protein S18 acetylase RimI-like enzyme
MNYHIREMTMADYDDVTALWKNTEYIALNECDTREGMEFYLARNPGLSFVAEEGGTIVGAVICGHEGRRGFLRHMAVANTLRGAGNWKRRS